MPAADLSTLLHLHFRPDLGLLTVRWLRDPATLAEAQAAHQAILDRACTEGTGNLLMDRRRSVPDAEVSQWVALS
ncbi:hypothetical protein GCM10027048_28350 [Hymenobacter coalescens]